MILWQENYKCPAKSSESFKKEIGRVQQSWSEIRLRRTIEPALSEVERADKY